MSLATRCPVCSTVFRVVQDQLKVSEGWVRCGRCAKVFNAFEGLFDLERELASMKAPVVTPAQRVLEDLAKRARSPKPASDWQPEDVDTSPSFLASASAPLETGAPFRASRPAPLLHTATPFRVGVSTPIAPPSLGAGAAAEAAGAAAAAAQPEGALELRVDPVPIPTGVEASDTGTPDESAETFVQSDGELDSPTAHPSTIDILLDDPEPESEAPSGDVDSTVDSRHLSFVRQADKAARWQRPWVRAGLGVLALGLAVLLAAQVALAQRDLVAAQWPEARPGLLALCAAVNCRIEPLRRIDRLSVDSSGLTRIDDGPVYRLAMVLRNRGDTALLLPSIDLSLTDSAGALVARRVLSAAELGAQRTTIAPGQEQPLQALLLSSERPLTGYTIEIFYP
jgi:predicted Zn finger-like uncharacterized protein